MLFVFAVPVLTSRVETREHLESGSQGTIMLSMPYGFVNDTRNTVVELDAAVTKLGGIIGPLCLYR